VHAHFLPNAYREALRRAGLSQPDGIHALPDWDAETAISVMDDLGIATAMLSISSPGVHFGNDAEAVELARLVNDEGARLKREHPGRFGFFASLALPDVDAAVIEARRALDDLGADGIVLSTNHHGMYLGDPKLEPLYAALDARQAVVFVHPTSPSCSCSARLDSALPRPLLEFQFETTRSVADLVLTGTLRRFPNIRVIVPHAGATLPILANRIELLLPLLTSADGADHPSMRDAMKQLHFDLAGAPVPHLLTALLASADPAKLHYGSDYPFTPPAACHALAAEIENTGLLSDAQRDGIWRSNAERLFSCRHVNSRSLEDIISQA
jgi:predicted TIM-barrel fold metal-dependent hydrolase